MAQLKQYIQMLQVELEKRSKEAVVSATRMRELELQLSETRQSESTESPPVKQHQQRPEDEPKYAGKLSSYHRRNHQYHGHGCPYF